MDISHWISHHAKWSPEKIALHFEGAQISYQQFEKEISQLSGGLVHQLGIKTGDRIAYLGENSPEFLIILFACARIGAIFVPLNARMTVVQHRYYLENCEPKCLFIEDQFALHAKACIDSTSSIKMLFLEESKNEDSCFRTLISDSPPVTVNELAPLSTPLLIAYTSGSTGLPKGAVISQETLFYAALNAIKVAEMTSEDHILTNLPMFHVGGLTVHTLPALHIGASVTLHRLFDAEQTLLDFEKQRITVYLALPKISRKLSTHKNWHSTDLSSLRLTQTGSTIVPLSVMTSWTERNIPAQQIYGLTEALPPAIGLPLAKSEDMAGSMGKQTLYCDARIVDENFNDVSPGERGEIILKGLCVFSEYWKNPEATKKAFTDGWFHTGDVGHVDDNGYLYMDDRIKNIIIVGSSNVYPADLEHILSECDEISEAAVVGRPDDDLGEVPIVCVKLKPGRHMSKNQVDQLFRSRLAVYQQPKEVIFVKSFPRTSLGKIQKNEVWEQVQNL
jgi:fatty-acyl-CoA synthase